MRPLLMFLTIFSQRVQVQTRSDDILSTLECTVARLHGYLVAILALDVTHSSDPHRLVDAPSRLVCSSAAAS